MGKIMKLKFTIKYFLLSALSVSVVNVYALMPKVICHSVCPATPIQYRSNQPMPIGATCAQEGAYRFYYRTLGKGFPTIIFSSGTGFPADGWYESGIASKMAGKAHVFTYDRALTFNSCPNPNNYMPLTAQDVVDHLRQLLKHENIKPPYILVGHSMGGLYMLLYTREFPKEVAGLVLMDATSDLGPTPLPIKAMKILTQLGNPQNPVPEDPLYNEIIGQLPSYIQIKNAPPLIKDIPLVVMYATKHCLPIAWTKKLMCMTTQQEENHKKGQMKMYNMSNIHKLIQVDGDHMSFFTKEKNSIVIDALNSILYMSQKRASAISNKTERSNE